MKHRRSKQRSDPLGAMLKDYLSGDYDAYVEVSSETVETWTMSGEIMFRGYGEMDELERMALSLCRGKVLDVGAGSGCHSLHLQETGIEVYAMDSAPGCAEVMRKRGVAHVIEENYFTYESGPQFDTLLFLMNGLGIAGTIFGLTVLLEHAASLLVPGGQIIAESTDLSPLFDGEFDYSMESYSGEIDFVMHYGTIHSDPFYWLYLDFATLRTLASMHGYHCDKIMELEDNRYLTRLRR